MVMEDAMTGLPTSTALPSGSVGVPGWPPGLQQQVLGDNHRSLSLDYSHEINAIDVDIAHNRAGFYGSVSGQVAGAVSFVDIIDLSIVMTSLSDVAHVTAAAVEGPVNLFLDAGEAPEDEDWLNMDFTGLRNVVFEVNPSGSAISDYGSFLNFERYNITLGKGMNRVRTGAGDDHISSIGIDAVDGGEGIDSWFGDYATNRSGLTFTMDGASGALSNGTTLASIEGYFVRTGTGNDSFDITNPTTEEQPQGVRGGGGFDTLRIDLAESAPETGAFTINSLGEKSYSGTLGGDRADFSFSEIEAVTVVYGAADDIGIVRTGSISRIGGSLSIDGGDGYDTVIIPALRSGYSIRGDGKGGVIIDDIDRSNGDTGWFTVQNFEAAAFADQTVALDSIVSSSALADLIGWPTAAIPYMNLPDMLV